MGRVFSLKRKRMFISRDEWQRVLSNGFFQVHLEPACLHPLICMLFWNPQSKLPLKNVFNISKPRSITSMETGTVSQFPKRISPSPALLTISLKIVCITIILLHVHPLVVCYNCVMFYQYRFIC